MQQNPPIAVVTKPTRLAGLRSRWGTARQAQFRLAQAAGHEVSRRRTRRHELGLSMSEAAEDQMEFEADALTDQDAYESEEEAYQCSLEMVMREVNIGYPLITVDRSFLPNFDFGRCVAVIVVGPDGLVANAAKYVGDVPIIGVNPDPRNIDGVLLPFGVKQAREALRRTLNKVARIKEVTLAEVNLADGQRMLAFNDFFVGASSHVSARYTLECSQGNESHSSSGVLISTGAGSTGWLSSMFNMAAGLCRQYGLAEPPPLTLDSSVRMLVWAVREPFVSVYSSANHVFGALKEGDELVLGSQMPSNGVIFSDGIESDYLEFTSGTIARFFVSPQKARLVVA